MNISLWVWERKTNTSLDLVSLRSLPRRGKCEMHEKAARRSHAVLWHLHCLLSSHQILSCPLIISNNMANSDGRVRGMKLKRERRRNLSATQNCTANDCRGLGGINAREKRFAWSHNFHLKHWENDQNVKKWPFWLQRCLCGVSQRCPPELAR